MGMQVFEAGGGILVFKPVRIEHNGDRHLLRPYETSKDLDFLLGVVERQRCIPVQSLSCFKLVQHCGIEASRDEAVWVSRSCVGWDGLLDSHLPSLEHIDWTDSLEPGDRLVIKKISPFFDPEAGELWFNNQLIKRFVKPAENQRRVLVEFQENGWPKQIDNPIQAKSDGLVCRFSDTITELNKGHQTPGILRFRGDGTSEGVRWEVLATPRNKPH